MLVSEQVLTLSNQVGVLTNKAYQCAPMLVSDLQALSGDLRGLYEQVLEIEPSREDVRAVEARLYRYPSQVDMLKRGTPEWWRVAWECDHPSHNPCEDRVQGGESIALAQRLAEMRDTLEREIDQQLQEARDNVADIDEAMDKLPNRLRMLLEMRYFNGDNWYDIAEAIGVTRQWAYSLKDDALLMLSRGLKS